MKESKSETRRVREIYSERDQTVSRYNHVNPSHREMILSRDRSALSFLQRAGLNDLSALDILDVGCGSGDWLLALLRWGCDPGRMTGLDLVSERIAKARSRLPQSLHLMIASGTNLSFREASIDLVIQSTILSSVLDPCLREKVASETLRVLRPGASILCYDLNINNPANSDVRKVPLGEIRRLYPGCKIQSSLLTLAPPLARRITPISIILGHCLERIPFLCSHRMTLITKPEICNDDS
jgi:ubiquinone/menaquinone biosynthesis C-methylase UbiE